MLIPAIDSYARGQPGVFQMMPKIFAHRGGAGYFVENSLKAFKSALESGCDGAECDVHLTKDGEVIVHHNPQLNHRYARKADGLWINKDDELYFDQLSLAEAQDYTIGEPNPETHDLESWPNLLPATNQRIPTLRQVIETIKSRSNIFQLIIEIKTDIFNPKDHHWIPLVDQIHKIIREEDFAQQTILCGFDWRPLLYAQNQITNVPLWFTTHPFSWLRKGKVPKTDIPPSTAYLNRLRHAYSDGKALWYAGLQPESLHDFPNVIKKAGGQAWFCYHTDATNENTKHTHEAGLNLAVWTVNLRDSEALERLNLVDAVCVDYPKYRL